jgi:hypothetical protein
MKKVIVMFVVSFLTVSAFGATRKVFILFEQKTRHIDRIAALRARIDQLGGRTHAVIGLAAIIADVDPRASAQLARVEGVRAVHDRVVEAPAGSDVHTRAAVAAWNRIVTDKPATTKPLGERPRNRPATDVLDPPDLPREGARVAELEAEYQREWAAFRRTLPTQLQRSSSTCGTNGAGYLDTSLYFAGDVAVGVVYVGGTVNGNPAGWSQLGSATTASTVQAFADVASALYRFLTIQPNARIALTFSNEVDSSGNPQQPPTNERTYVNNLRNTYCTDWGLLIDVRNTDVNQPNGWPNAYLHGPSLRMNRNFAPFEEVLDHEIGHIFGAGDAYPPMIPSPRYGYALAAHANACGSGCGYFLGGTGECLEDLMAGWGPVHGYNTIVGVWTAKQLGWYTSLGDGVPDVLRTKPLIGATSVAFTINPTTYAVTFTGTATDRAVLDELSSTYGNVSINRIMRVEYRISNGPWLNASASDGTFDSNSEAFQFTTTPLRSMPLLVEIRAVNTIGATTPFPHQTPLTVTGSTVTNTQPFPALTLSTERVIVNTPITASGTDSRDLEPGTLQYAFKWGNGPCCVFGTAATATHAFSSTGPQTVQIHVKDAGNLIQQTSRTVLVEAADTSPTIALSVTPANRHLINTATYTVSMSVNGSRDSETPFASLRVQWDVDCDGVWDAPPSLQKTRTVTLTNPNHPKSDRRCIGAQVLDSSNNADPTQRFTVLVPYNTPPVINGLTFTPSGSNFTVMVNATDPDGPWDGSLEYRFDFEGDGIWDTPFGPGASATVLAANVSTLIVEVSDYLFGRAVRAACFPLSC